MPRKLRFICHESNSVHVVNGGASRAVETYKTFEIDCPPDLEEWLNAGKDFDARQVLGVEIRSAQ